MNKDKKNSVFEKSLHQIRTDRLKMLTKSDTVYAKMITVYLVVLACFLSDFYMIKVRWNLVQMESALFVWCSAATCAAALNVPLSVAGIVLKKNEQGLCGKRERNMTVALAVGIFAIAYVCNFAFTWVTKDLVFSIGSSSTLVNNASSASAEQETHMGLLVAAFYSAVMPLLTSMTSFVISYFAYNPLFDNIKKLKTEKIEIDASILDINVALEQGGSPEKFCEGLMASENDKYELEIRSLDEDNQLFKQEVEFLLAEKVKTAKENGEVSKSSHLLLETHKQQKLSIKQQLPDYILKHLILNDKEQIVGIKTAKDAA